MSLGDPRVPSTSCGGRDKSASSSPYSATTWNQSWLWAGGGVRWVMRGEQGQASRSGSRRGQSGLARCDWFWLDLLQHPGTVPAGLFEFHFMQTDPNWSNFFYDPELHKVSTRRAPTGALSSAAPGLHDPGSPAPRGPVPPPHGANLPWYRPSSGGSSGLRGSSGI